MSGEKEEGFNDQWQLQLPPGFRFVPTDVELLQYYLLRKVNGQFIYPGIIHEADVYERNPFHLPGMDMEEETFTYFFTRRERKYPNGSRADRSTRDGRGYWKITSKNNEISSTDNKVHLGKKNTLVYFVKTPDGKDDKTAFIMHEFELNEKLFPSTSQGKQFNDFVVCRVYYRKKRKEENVFELKDMTNSLIELKPVMTHNNGEPPLPSRKRKFQPNESLTMCHPHHGVPMMKSNYLYNSQELQAAAILDNMKTKDFGQSSNTLSVSFHTIVTAEEEQNSGLIEVKTDGNDPVRLVGGSHNMRIRDEGNIPLVSENVMEGSSDLWDIFNRAPPREEFSYFRDLYGV
ncbi:hypothetical protein K7X08_022498 [Anisodus acutangulus]|uniref:NAC domain-containing protein n=1 Tax=Anisodus acutangulus TaxID=402998 RepID=A0A9Q1RHP6_9SOLA|nr:hypothetical protein K7X08_022498 [Anisodus acutangulus]